MMENGARIPPSTQLRHREVLTEQFAAIEALIDEAEARHAVGDVTPRSERSWRDEAGKRLRIVRSIAKQYSGPAIAAQVQRLEDGIAAGQALLDEVLKARRPAGAGATARPRSHREGVCPRLNIRASERHRYSLSAPRTTSTCSRP